MVETHTCSSVSANLKTEMADLEPSSHEDGVPCTPSKKWCVRVCVLSNALHEHITLWGLVISYSILSYPHQSTSSGLFTAWQISMNVGRIHTSRRHKQKKPVLRGPPGSIFCGGKLTSRPKHPAQENSTSRDIQEPPYMGTQKD